ncbi:NAD dependent epimerase/dehydratase [Venturia nashicola]|nr:NAD dependent epimerase/dehydratase [Venturia nashicola]
MSKVLLTGGSGFIAAHVLNVLLERGYAVVTTVRSNLKGDQILAAHPGVSKEQLSYVVVPDIAEKGAFDEAVRSDPPFEYVLHIASPVHHKSEDPVKDMLEPAINGTVGILRAAKAFAPQVKRVVITSSFAAMYNASPPKVYDETSWNPVTWDEAVTKRSAYLGSKTFAERAAWDFVEKEKPNFDISTLTPPLVFGPIVHHLDSLDSVNTSNEVIRDLIQGKILQDKLPSTGSCLFVDVRDLAIAHVQAIEVPEAGGKRFFTVAGYYSFAHVVEAIRKTHPELSSKLPKNPIDDTPEDIYGYDNSRTREILGIKFTPLEKSIGDTAASLLDWSAKLQSPTSK